MPNSCVLSKPFFHAAIAVLLIGFLLTAPGCRRAPIKKDYTRPLPPGAHGLRKLSPGQYPDLEPAFNRADDSLKRALDRSLDWFTKPSTVAHFPVAGISHEHARASVQRFRQLLDETASGSQFEQAVYREFDIYTSVGWNGQGEVLFTGYHSPIYDASWQRTNVYRYPLYQSPPDLVRDPLTGKTLGRKIGDRLVTYPTRSQILSAGILKGRELVYFKHKLDPYFIEVNGSAKLNMSDGSTAYIGYSGTNGLEYTSIGKLLIKRGKIAAEDISLQTIRAHFDRYPNEIETYIMQNDRMVFFEQYKDASVWPKGALAVKITPGRTLATDKSIFPRACPVLVTTQIYTNDGSALRRFEQFMVDQDAGGAIRSPGRADIYMGIGPQAEAMAGRQKEEGRLYYFLLKK